MLMPRRGPTAGSRQTNETKCEARVSAKRAGRGPSATRVLTSSKLTSLVEVWDPVAIVPEVMALVVMSRRWSVGMIQ